MSSKVFLEEEGMRECRSGEERMWRGACRSGEYFRTRKGVRGGRSVDEEEGSESDGVNGYRLEGSSFRRTGFSMGWI